MTNKQLLKYYKDSELVKLWYMFKYEQQFNNIDILFTLTQIRQIALVKLCEFYKTYDLRTLAKRIEQDL